jgi:hypothetical protein
MREIWYDSTRATASMPQSQTSKTLGVILIAASIVASFIFLNIASRRDLNGLENTLFQVLSLGLGLLGSFIFGRESAKDAALEIIKPHAKSAFRRLISLNQSLYRVASVIASARQGNEDEMGKAAVLPVLEAVVTEQLVAVNHALEDWRDVVPEEYDEVNKRLAARTLEQNKLESNE